METTTVEVSQEQADRLFSMKKRGEAYRHVVDRLLVAWEKCGESVDVEHADRPDRADDEQGGKSLADEAKAATDRVREQLPDE